MSEEFPLSVRIKQETRTCLEAAAELYGCTISGLVRSLAEAIAEVHDESEIQKEVDRLRVEFDILREEELISLRENSADWRKRSMNRVQRSPHLKSRVAEKIARRRFAQVYRQTLNPQKCKRLDQGIQSG